MELFKRLRIAEVAARFGLTFGRHRGDAERGHVIAECGAFARGVGDVDVVIENAHSKSQLCQFAVTHDDIRLEAAVF